MKTLERLFAYAFVIGSIWPDPFGSVGAGLLGRVVPADLAGAALIVCWLLRVLKRETYIPRLVFGYTAFLAVILLGVVTSLDPDQTIIELTIHVFLGLVCVALVNTFLSVNGFRDLISSLSVALVLASILGFWNLFVVTAAVGTAAPVAGATSGFRNTGQAGAYALIGLCVLIPFRLSRLYSTANRARRMLTTLAVILGLAFIISTVKVAALIGLAALLAGTALRAPKLGFRKMLGAATVLSLLLLATGYVLFVYRPDWRDYANHKFETRLDRNEADEGFLGTNWRAALVAFEANPLCGSGVGGFASYGDGYEVHSTYLKMLGECGLLGIAGYSLFIWQFLTLTAFRLRRLTHGPYSDFLDAFGVAVWGCLLSWAYTYHLRKREFWIAVALVCIASELSRRYERLQPDRTLNTTALLLRCDAREES
jgi:hypothetical protein